MVPAPARASLRAALLAAATLACGCGAAPEPASEGRRADAPPDVLLVTLDTTRADHLGVYGHARPTSPVLDRLAAESLVFERAVSTSSWTLPAHASLFTGKLPAAHGAGFDPQGELLLAEGLPDQQDVPEVRVSTIADGERTLAERLAEAGYTTLGVAGGPWMKRVFGLAAGFSGWDESRVDSWQGAVAPDVTDAALALLGEVRDEPFFLFVNYFDPHNPFRPPLLDRLRVLGDPLALLGQGRAGLTANGYDGEIRCMDRELGRLLDALRARGRYDQTLVVVTADHGELFGEGGHFGHGHYLSEAELHVPLLVKLPGGARGGERIATRVSTAGVFGLILEQAGLAVDPEALPSVTAPLPGPVVAETYPTADAAPDGHWRALYLGSFKYLWNSRGHHELRDLGEGGDPEANRILHSPELAERMDEELGRVLAAARPAPREHTPARAIDPATREALEGLGYLR